ncbi:Amino acid transporter AVT3C [Acropora cervicornis]|uniref:Amino acid transporter AVT3C n=1 Tax=Acropora cervicornis TaxID=6130 RepID=A0AAD9VEG5_ACRCE|nr:Amino acid transporter AVT3C [Acropora cervicornis]
MTGPQYKQHSSGVPLIRPTVLRQVADFANVFKAFIGTNWIGLPFAFKESGFVLGLVGILVIAVVTDHCCQLVIKCKRATVQKVLDTVCLSDVTDVESQLTQAALLRDTVEKRMQYGDIARIAMGKWGVLLVNMALLATQYGFCVGYFIFMGNTIASMFTTVSSVPSTLHNESASNVTSPSNVASSPSHSHQAPPFALIVLIPLLPLILLSYIRGVRRLGPISFMANIALFVAFLSVIGYMLSVTSAYEGIGTLIPIETSMAESKHRFPLYLHFAIGGLSAILACFGMLGYLVYGEEVAQIVTRSFHPGPLVLVVQCLLCFAILLTYPLQLVPIIEIVESWLFKSEAKNATTESSLNNDLSTSSDDMISQVDTKSVTVNECSRLLAPEIPKEKSRLRQWKKNLLRTFLVLSTAGIAIALKRDFAFVSAIVGSVGSSTLGFILPCVFHLVLCKETNTRLIKAKDCLLIAFGLVGGVVGLTVTIMQIVEQFSKT